MDSASENTIEDAIENAFSVPKTSSLISDVLAEVDFESVRCR
jgi:hypothetical protein